MKFILIIILSLVFSIPAFASENKGQLPFTPVPMNPDSKAYQPFYGYESDRRTQGQKENKVKEHKDYKHEKDYRDHGNRGKHKGR